MRRLMKLWWILLLLIAVLLPIAWLQVRAPHEPSDRVKELLGPEAMAILSDADRVEVFRIDGYSRDGDLRQKLGPRMRGFLVTGHGDDQGKGFARDLAAVLFKDQTHFDNGWAKCFWPGVAYRVWKGKQRVDVLICFFCDNLLVTAKADDPGKEEWETGSFVDTSSRALLVKLAKRAFPNDPEIVELKETKR
jgi:hypothetical protein